VSIDAEALDIYQAALALEDDEERNTFVAARCNGNAALRARIERMAACDDTGVRLLATETLTAARVEFTAIPQRLGPYRVTGEIARGGMGMVVKAEREDGVYEQTVAIKLIRGDLASADSRARFDLERRILARLVHPAIVRILDGGDADGSPWLAMDLVDGRPVTEQLQEAGLASDAVLAIFLDICDAVAFAHSKLVVHADIKPSNVLLTAKHEVRIVDFGIARLIVELDGHETGSVYPLTRTYAAPERSGGGAPTIASDVYSLGVLLREMLHANADRPLPRDLAAIMAKATNADPQARYVDVTSLASDVRRFRNHVPVGAVADPGWIYRTGCFLRRHRVAVAVTGAFMAILAAATVFSTAQYLRAERERAAADQRFADVRGTARYLLYGLMPRLENTPDSLVFRVEVAGVAQHYLDRLAGASQASDDLRLEAADGLTTLAEMQGGWEHPNLGQTEAGLANLRKAEALAASLPPAARAPLEARIHIDEMFLTLMKRTDLAGARRFAGLATADLRSDPHVPPVLAAQYWNAMGELAAWQKQSDVEQHDAKTGLAAIAQETSRDAILVRGRLLGEIGNTIAKAHPPSDDASTPAPAGLYDYGRQYIAVYASAVKQWPNDIFMLARLGSAWAYLGQYQLTYGDPATLVSLRRAFEDLQKVKDFEPHDATTLRQWHLTAVDYAYALARFRHADASVAVLRQLIADDDRRLRQNPADADIARFAAVEQEALAEMLGNAHRMRAACVALATSRADFAALATKGLLLPRDRFHLDNLQQLAKSFCGA